MKRRSFVGGAMAGCLGVAAGGLRAQTADVVPEKYMPQIVRLKADLPPYQVHVDPAQFALFWTLPDREAIRYTVGIGRPGLYEHGEFYVGAKKEWPSWTPTQEMIERDSTYAQWEDGMPGGPQNPLGARALYLFQPGRGDTYLRIHGTNDPATIARRVSNGCARLVNSHVVDLYNRVPMNTRIVLYPAA